MLVIIYNLQTTHTHTDTHTQEPRRNSFHHNIKTKNKTHTHTLESSGPASWKVLMSVGTDAAMEMGSLMSRPLADSGSELQETRCTWLW